MHWRPSKLRHHHERKNAAKARAAKTPLKSPEIIITPSTMIEPEEEDKPVTGRRRRSAEEAERVAQLEKEKEEKKENEPTPLYRDESQDVNQGTGGIPSPSLSETKGVDAGTTPNLDNGVNGHTGDATFAAMAVVVGMDSGIGF